MFRKECRLTNIKQLLWHEAGNEIPGFWFQTWTLIYHVPPPLSREKPEILTKTKTSEIQQQNQWKKSPLENTRWSSHKSHKEELWTAEKPQPQNDLLGIWSFEMGSSRWNKWTTVIQDGGFMKGSCVGLYKTMLDNDNSCTYLLS